MFTRKANLLVSNSCVIKLTEEQLSPGPSMSKTLGTDTEWKNVAGKRSLSQGAHLSMKGD
jgi:hypothetical protein